MTIHGFAHYLVGHDDLVSALTAALSSTAEGATISLTPGDGAKIQASLDAAGTRTAVQALLVDAVTPTKVEWVALSSVTDDTVTLGERALDDTTAQTFASGSQVLIGIGAETITRIIRAVQTHDTLAVNVRAYGALGDVQTATDGGMTSGQPTLHCASGPFVPTDEGKAIEVYDATSSGVPLRTTILQYTDNEHVILAVNAGATVTGKTVYWGTDDSAAFRAAVAAAALTLGSTVYVPPGTYYLTATTPAASLVSVLCETPITIRGAGRDVSILRQHAEDYISFLFHTTFTVEHLGFHNAEAASWKSNSPIRLDFEDNSDAVAGTKVVVRDCDFLNVNIGLFVRGASETDPATNTTRYIDQALVENCKIVINPLRTNGGPGYPGGAYQGGVNPTIVLDYCEVATIKGCYLEAECTANPGSANNIYCYGNGSFIVEDNYIAHGIGVKFTNSDTLGTVLVRIHGNHFYRCQYAIQHISVETNTDQILIDSNHFDQSECLVAPHGDIMISSANDTVAYQVGMVVIRNNFWAACGGQPIILGVGAAGEMFAVFLQGNYYQGWGVDHTGDVLSVLGTGAKQNLVIIGDVADGLSIAGATRYHLYSSTTGFSRLSMYGLIEISTGGGASSTGTSNSTALSVTPSGGSPASLTAEMTGGPTGPAVDRWIRVMDAAGQGWVPVFR